MTADLTALFAARAEAERTLFDARKAAGVAARRVTDAGLDAFMEALAARGITSGSPIVIAGKYSGAWGERVRRLEHDATPVILRHVTVDDAPWTDPPKNSTARLWWFRLSIARMKKDGTPRDEYRNTLVHGVTPEAAAMQVGAVEARHD